LSLPETPLGPLKRRDDEPVFDEPWQAQALGMADVLVTAGVISADAWALALGAELRKGATAGVADDAEAYYRAVLAALQTLLYEAGATAREEVEVREAEWRRAYLNTPHGMPVELGASDLAGDDLYHDHD
jgi:nitrile hydratase accessory protein